MSVGTAIFLSSLVLATVILYGITKDRWRWRGIVGTLAQIVAAIVVIAVVVIGGSILVNQFPMAVGPQTEYAALRLGMSQAEVMYIKGYPSAVLAAPPRRKKSGRSEISLKTYRSKLNR